MAHPPADRPTLALAMIVRDEAHNLAQWLPQARSYVDEMVVVDTGSSDGTVSLLEEVGARVIHVTWEDNFSHARNRGLDEVRSDWVLVLDADERLAMADWKRIASFLTHDDVVAYDVQIKNYHALDDLTDFDLMRSYRLFRNNHEIRYEGAVHNQIAASIERAALHTGRRVEIADLVVHHYGYALTPEAMRIKRERIYRMLQQTLAAHPDDPFYLFHKLSVCHAMGRYREAQDVIDALPFDALRTELRAKAHCKAAQVALFFDALDRADHHIRAAQALTPSAPFLYQLQSQVLYQTGRFDAGIQAALRALQLAQSETEEAEGIHVSEDQLMANVAVGFMLRGEYPAAERYLHRALQLNPLNNDARTWLSRLAELQLA